MRLLNDGDRYNYIFAAAAKSALASRWLQVNVATPPVDHPSGLPIKPMQRMQRYRLERQQQFLGLI